MKKIFLSTLALAGLAAAFAAPAQAQQASIAGAGVNVARNGNSVQAFAGEVVFPEGIYATDVTVDAAVAGTENTANYVFTGLDVAAITAPTGTAVAPTTIEAAIANVIGGATPTADTLEAAISLVNAFQ